MAVNKVPPNPNKLNGAKELKFFREHIGNKTANDNKIITLDRWASWPDNPNVYEQNELMIGK